MSAVPASLQPLVLDELARVCASDALARAPALLRLLRHLVERHVAGDHAALREAAIAFDVFRRDAASYDPQADPIVRVSIRRLRDRLDTHYRACGDATLRIVVPRGRYVPEYAVAPSARAARTGLAVLRMRNATEAPAGEAICASFADRLADQLARAGVRGVVARSSVDRAAERSGDVVALAAALDAAWVLEPVLAHEGGAGGRTALRAVTRLLDGTDATVRWTLARAVGAHDPDGDRLIDAVVMRACETLPGTGIRAAPLHAGRLAPEQRNALDAARLLLLQRRVDATDEAVALAERVTAEAPDAAAGWAALASALYSRSSFQDRDVARLAGGARMAAERALALDPGEPVALRTLAILVGRRDWDIAAAATLFERALRSMPHYTSARLNLAELHLLDGDGARALAEANLALVYDPLSTSVRLCRALVLAHLGRHDEARAEWAILRASGESSFWVLTGPACMEVAAGRIDEGTALARAARRRFPGLPDPLFALAYAAAARGERTAALRHDAALHAHFPHFSPTRRALVYARLRDRAGVLARLDEALAARDVAFLYAAIADEFAWLAEDPAFVARLAAGGRDRWRGLCVRP